MHSDAEETGKFKSSMPTDENRKILKPCCACPDTRQQRDQCVLIYGEEMCADLIKAHKECLKKLGFTIL